VSKIKWGWTDISDKFVAESDVTRRHKLGRQRTFNQLLLKLTEDKLLVTCNIGYIIIMS